MERQRWFRGLMDQWLPKCPPIKRLAFTASLLQPATGRRASYELLDSYLRCVDIDPESSEFLYRINRRRDSAIGVPGLVINRLSTWLGAKFVVLTGLVEAGIPEQPLRQQETSYCALELDINTAPDFPRLLPQGDLIRIFGELVESAVEIATRGDMRQ
jgi:hypothetical protein